MPRFLLLGLGVRVCVGAEEAKEYLQRRLGATVVAGLMSPASDHYAKPHLAPAAHRVAMCRIALQSSDWIRYHDQATLALSASTCKGPLRT